MARRFDDQPAARAFGRRERDGFRQGIVQEKPHALVVDGEPHDRGPVLDVVAVLVGKLAFGGLRSRWKSNCPSGRGCNSTPVRGSRRRRTSAGAGHEKLFGVIGKFQLAVQHALGVSQPGTFAQGQRSSFGGWVCFPFL